MKPTDHDQPQSFHMVFNDKLDQLLFAAANGEVQDRDAMVLLAIIRHTNWLTGKAPVTIAALAESIGRKRPNVSSSVARLKRQFLVATGVDTRSRQRFLMLNPYLCCRSSREDKQRELYGQFVELLE